MWRLLGLMLLCGVASGCVDHAASNENIGTPPSAILPSGPLLETFDLTTQEAQPFNSKSLKGQVWIGSFFFTNCPAICWRLNQALANWQKEHAGSKTKFISITCDPQNDTPETLKKYANHFQADPQRWSFLTGDLTYIRRVSQDIFKLSLDKQTHSDRCMVVDREGKIRGYFRVLDPDELKKFNSSLAAVEAEAAPSASTSSQPDSDKQALPPAPGP